MVRSVFTIMLKLIMEGFGFYGKTIFNCLWCELLIKESQSVYYLQSRDYYENAAASQALKSVHRHCTKITKIKLLESFPIGDFDDQPRNSFFRWIWADSWYQSSDTYISIILVKDHIGMKFWKGIKRTRVGWALTSEDRL